MAGNNARLEPFKHVSSSAKARSQLQKVQRNSEISEDIFSRTRTEFKVSAGQKQSASGKVVKVAILRSVCSAETCIIWKPSGGSKVVIEVVFFDFTPAGASATTGSKVARHDSTHLVDASTESGGLKCSLNDLVCCRKV